MNEADVASATEESGNPRADRTAVVGEVKRLGDDPEDRDEMRLLRELMAELAPGSVV